MIAQMFYDPKNAMNSAENPPTPKVRYPKCAWPQSCKVA